MRLRLFMLAAIIGGCAPRDDESRRQGEAVRGGAPIPVDARSDPWWEHTVARDLTGDGRAETLRLVARGYRPESLKVTFSITAVDSVLYTLSWPSDGYFAYEGPIESIPPSRLAERTRSALSRFLNDDAFGTTAEVDSGEAVETISHQLCVTFANGTYATDPSCLDTLVRPLWQDMVRRNVVTFSFGSGGEVSRTIVWSTRMRRFLEVFACC